jgi:hypothetical protein
MPLGNGPSPGLDDFVGVVEEWCWPDSFADVTVDKARDVQRRLSQGEWRADPRSTKWAGKAVAEVLDLDLEEPSLSIDFTEKPGLRLAHFERSPAPTPSANSANSLNLAHPSDLASVAKPNWRRTGATSARSRGLR